MKKERQSFIIKKQLSIKHSNAALNRNRLASRKLCINTLELSDLNLQNDQSQKIKNANKAAKVSKSNRVNSKTVKGGERSLQFGKMEKLRVGKLGIIDAFSDRIESLRIIDKIKECSSKLINQKSCEKIRGLKSPKKNKNLKTEKSCDIKIYDSEIYYKKKYTSLNSNSTSKLIYKPKLRTGDLKDKGEEKKRVKLHKPATSYNRRSELRFNLNKSKPKILKTSRNTEKGALDNFISPSFINCQKIKTPKSELSSNNNFQNFKSGIKEWNTQISFNDFFLCPDDI